MEPIKWHGNSISGKLSAGSILSSNLDVIYFSRDWGRIPGLAIGQTLLVLLHVIWAGWRDGVFNPIYEDELIEPDNCRSFF